MRKMINRKGFSLVELMIVVVIMGILIAVAVPLYNAVTDNAEKRTCQDNQRVIRSAYTRCALDDSENKVNSIFNDGYNSFNGSSDDQKAVLRQSFLTVLRTESFLSVRFTERITSFHLIRMLTL